MSRFGFSFTICCFWEARILHGVLWFCISSMLLFKLFAIGGSVIISNPWCLWKPLKGFWVLLWIICRYGGDILIISAIISLFLPFTRKWMWVYIVVICLFNSSLDSYLHCVSSYSKTCWLCAYSWCYSRSSYWIDSLCIGNRGVEE